MHYDMNWTNIYNKQKVFGGYSLSLINEMSIETSFRLQRNTGGTILGIARTAPIPLYHLVGEIFLEFLFVFCCPCVSSLYEIYMSYLNQTGSLTV